MKAKYDQLNQVISTYSLDQYQPDIKTFEKRDVWRPLGFNGFTKGDCEDFALGYFYQLRALGWSDQSMRIAICKLFSGQMHAVLLVDTENGTFALDGRKRFALPYRSRVLRVKKWYGCGGPMAAEWQCIIQPTGPLPQGMRGGAPLSEAVKVSGVSSVPPGLMEYQEYLRGQDGEGQKQISVNH